MDKFFLGKQRQSQQDTEHNKCVCVALVQLRLGIRTTTVGTRSEDRVETNAS